MIKKDEVFKIGIFNKPHGVKGEISFTFTDDIFDRVECEYLVCLLDGIFVPFFIEEYRFRSDTTALVKLEGVDTSEKARMFTNVEVYFPKKYVVEGCNADVVTLALEHDITLIQNTGLIDAGWKEEFSDDSSPYTSTIVFLVRKGNPKQIQDWNDLIREDVDRKSVV